MDQENLTLSKITPPLLSGIIPRKRLFRLMDAGRKRPVLWICGPPGSGKTTLAASYLRSRKIPCLWYRLDEGDDDAGSFFYYMGLAAKKASPRSRYKLPPLSPENLLALPAFARRYFRSLYGQFKSPSVIVFDNYHDLPAGALLHKVIHDGLNEVPSGINIIFTSRHDPPPSLADFRSKGMVEIIPWNVLSLTIQETKAIVKAHGKGVKLSADAIDTLHRRTCGWVAGLLLLLTEKPRTNVAFTKVHENNPPYSPFRKGGSGGFERSFPDETPSVVFDYLAGEVFERIDDQTKTFLLKTAFLPEMAAPMAGSLTDIPESRRILNYLYSHNLFIEKNPGAEPSYQYHPLFQEFLLLQARARFTGDAIAKIRKDAARLLESAGQVESALSLYIDAGDWGNAIRLICAQAPLLMSQGRGGTISTWLARLPQEVIDQTPWLLYWQGVLNLLSNQRESESLFERAYNLFDIQGDAAGVYLSWCGVVNAIFHAFEDFSKLDRWIAHMDANIPPRRSDMGEGQGGWAPVAAQHCNGKGVYSDNLRAKYPVFPSEDIRARVTYTMFLALIYRNPGHPDFHKWAEDAIEIFHHDRDSCLRMEVAFHLVCYCHMTGDLARSSIIIGQLRDSAGSLSSVSPLSLLGWKATEAFYSWLVGSPEECLKAVHEGLKVSEDTGVHHLDYVLHGQGISASLSCGNHTEAKRLLRKMASSLERGSRNDKCFYHYLAAWDALTHDDIPHALEHARSSFKLVAELGTSWQMFLSQLMMAQALHEKGEDQKAGEYLSQAEQFASQSRSPFFEYMCHIARAQFYSNIPPLNIRGVGGVTEYSHDQSCLESLRKAMAIGREKGIINFWGWRGSVMARLCAKALESGIEVDYVRALILRRRLKSATEYLDIDNWPWPLKVYTMGRFSVCMDGERIRFTRKAQAKPMEMLKVIIALGGRRIKEDRLHEILWPEADGAAAHSAFSSTLLRLRKLIGYDAITVSEGTISLSSGYCWVDIWALERLLNSTEQNRYSPALLDEKILRLYNGSFLSGEESAWALPLRERLSSKFIRYLRARGRLLEQAGDYEQAIILYQKGLEADPLSEGLYRCLMACYHATGSYAEAAAVYQRCRETLSAMLGILPSPKTDGLYLKIRNNSNP